MAEKLGEQESLPLDEPCQPVSSADSGNSGTKKLLRSLERTVARANERRRQKDLAEQAGEGTRATKPKATPRTRRRVNRGRASNSVIEQAQLSLFRWEGEGRFRTYPIRPESEFPTFLTRIPIFIPSKRSNQRNILDQDNAVPFATPWGEGRKHGPPLTVYDEDTLIAIGRLRQNMLVGEPTHMPVPVSDLYRAASSEAVHVHVVQCMLTDIQGVCGTTMGGRSNKMRLDSLKRLAATVIEFNNRTRDKLGTKGTSVKLIDVAWNEYDENAILLIQFSPVMAYWFEKEYTYLDWGLRKKLSDTGKAVHRFLSGQPREYEIQTKKLHATIGYVRPHNKFLADLREALDQLETEGWLKDYRIVGTGRKTPHKLVLKRR